MAPALTLLSRKVGTSEPTPIPCARVPAAVWVDGRRKTAIRATDPSRRHGAGSVGSAPQRHLSVLRGGGEGEEGEVRKSRHRALGVCYYPEHWPEEVWETDARQVSGRLSSSLRDKGWCLRVCTCHEGCLYALLCTQRASFDTCFDTAVIRHLPQTRRRCPRRASSTCASESLCGASSSPLPASGTGGSWIGPSRCMPTRLAISRDPAGHFVVVVESCSCMLRLPSVMDFCACPRRRFPAMESFSESTSRTIAVPSAVRHPAASVPTMPPKPVVHTPTHSHPSTTPSRCLPSKVSKS